MRHDCDLCFLIRLGVLVMQFTFSSRAYTKSNLRGIISNYMSCTFVFKRFATNILISNLGMDQLEVQILSTPKMEQ